MIQAKDQAGRELEFSVSGMHDDDLQIDEIYYLEGEPTVDEYTADWILAQYATEAYEYWMESKISAAEDFYEGRDHG